MTVISLQAESAPANPTQSEILYRAWRYAKAQWEIAENDPENPEGITDAERDAFCGVEIEAMMAYFMHPADDLLDVSRKLRSFIEEEGWQLDRAPEIVTRIREDVHGFALRGRR
jgi:hypothetical protein